jgi:hypothetical protein
MSDLETTNNDFIKKHHNESESVSDLINGLLSDEEYIESSDMAQYWDVLFQQMAESMSEGELSESERDIILSQLAESSFCSIPKTQMSKRVDEIVDNNRTKSVETDNTVTVKTINEWLEAHLTKVVKMTSTDSSAEPRYRFVFDEYDKVIETEREHRSFSEMEIKITALADIRVESPNFNSYPKYDDGDWTKYVTDLILSNQTTEEYTGTRTTCLESIMSRISTVYSSPEEAVDHGSAYYDETEQDLYIPSKLVNSQADAHGTTPEALQSELSAQSVVEGSVSKQLSVDGQPVRFWVIPESYAKEVHGIDLTTVSEDDTTNIGQNRVTESLE